MSDNRNGASFGGYQPAEIDDYACPFPWCGFEGDEDEIRDHVPECGIHE